MRIQALHCPSCGGPLEVVAGASRATCPYCAAVLVVENERVSTTVRSPAPLVDAFERVKYFRAGWKQPLGLSGRGVRDGSAGQQFDEGGEATVADGCRLFFPGGLQYEGQVTIFAA